METFSKNLSFMENYTFIDAGILKEMAGPVNRTF